MAYLHTGYYTAMRMNGPKLYRIWIEKLWFSPSKTYSAYKGGKKGIIYFPKLNLHKHKSTLSYVY